MKFPKFWKKSPKTAASEGVCCHIWRVREEWFRSDKSKRFGCLPCRLKWLAEKQAVNPSVRLTDGTAEVYVALTPELARDLHTRAQWAGHRPLAALVEPCIPQGGKVVCTVADRAFMRRLLRDATAV